MSLTEIKLRSTMKDLREGVNGNFAALEGQLGEKMGAVTGTYTGDGTYNQRAIELGFQPKCVILNTQQGELGWNGYIYGGCFFPDHPLPASSSVASAAEITSTGFKVSYSSSYRHCTNVKSTIYYYVAFR